MLKGGLTRMVSSMEHLLQRSEGFGVMKECRIGKQERQPFHRIIELFLLEEPSKIIESNP